MFNRCRPHNVLTVDVEDWYHVCGYEERTVAPDEWRVQANVEKLLSLLAEWEVPATFFILGSVAAALPDLVPRIAAAGHEVASHGYSHRLVTRLAPADFRREIRETAAILERQSGTRPAGFRAPQWSLRSGMEWAFEILREEGYRYDSSLTPLPFVGDRTSSRFPHLLTTSGGTLWEIPPLVTPTRLGNLPTGGGWGFRFFPEQMIEGSVEALNRSGNPAVLYLHPRELDPGGPRLSLSPLRTFAVYGPRRDAAGRLGRMVRKFRFGTMIDLVNKWEAA